jgi:opacity protein-like surface antigen
MTSPSSSSRYRPARAAAVIAALIAMAVFGRANAADLDDSYLRGAYAPAVEEPVNWDGFYLGGQIGYSNMTVDFSNTLNSSTFALPNQTTNSTTYGGFLGYNWQVDPNLVLGLELGYTRPSSLSSSSTIFLNNTKISASYKLDDFGTFRGRAGYAFGQFLPYAVFGVGIGRVDYTVSAPPESRDNAYTLGLVAGLGIDVALLPNVFLRGEWEYAYFTPVKFTASSVNTARVGIAVRF